MKGGNNMTLNPRGSNLPRADSTLSGPLDRLIRRTLAEKQSLSADASAGHSYYVDTPAYDHTRDS